MTSVDSISKISQKEFITKYQKPGLPVVVRNITNTWTSKIDFTPQFFREKFGNCVTNFEGKEYSMSEIMDITEKSTVENPAPYPMKFNLLTQLRDILPLMKPLHFNIAQPNWIYSKLFPKNKMGNSIDLFIGGPGNRYTIHKDAYDVHAWLIQLYGEKEVIIFPREQEALMYRGKTGMESFQSPIDISNPDYEKYPKFKEATPLKVTLKAGDAIYIPNGVWHTTQANRHNISIIVDQINSSNFKDWRNDVYHYRKEYSKVKAVIDYSAAVLIGNTCKLGNFLGLKF
ncbi:histone arginine demethylase JMJD6 [Pedobacter sp. UYP30]|uniref:cupin-like domain-containing protein n=1 Tax=Pedobacter sp. UYP30 TaxID=1756400 RepID=UPI00339B13ED